MTSPSEIREPISDTYPSQEAFEEILAEAEMNVQTPGNHAWLTTLREDYTKEGMSLELSGQERLLLRQLSTGAIR